MSNVTVLETVVRGMPITVVIDLSEMEVIDISLTKSGKAANWFKLSERETSQILDEAA